MMEDRKKPGQTLSKVLGFAGAIVLGIPGALFIAPRMYPQPPGEISVPQILCAGAFGAIGGLIGAVIGKVIEGSSGKD
jgi:hypothetical protein